MRDDIEAPWVGQSERDYYGDRPCIVDTCACCGRDILVGEEYYDIDGYAICEDCMPSYKRVAEERE